MPGRFEAEGNYMIGRTRHFVAKALFNTVFLTVFAFFVLPLDTLAFPTQEGRTLGEQALSYRRTANFWGDFTFHLIDAKVTTTPPDRTELDRRFEALTSFGAEAQLAGRWGFRFNTNSKFLMVRQADKDAPRAVTDFNRTVIEPSVDMTFVTTKGLELIAGTQIEFGTPYKQTRLFNGLKTTTKYHNYNIQSHRVGVTRRARTWSGGFYYILGGESERTFETVAADGSSLKADETVFTPAAIGVFGEIGRSTIYDFEFTFIQARGKGPTDSNGNSIYTDHFTAKVGNWISFSSFGLRLEASYRTLAYASSAFIDYETVPWTSFEIGVFKGDRRKTHAKFGVVGGYSRDGQSLPQFNAVRDAKALGITMGVFSPF